MVCLTAEEISSSLGLACCRLTHLLMCQNIWIHPSPSSHFLNPCCLLKCYCSHLACLLSWVFLSQICADEFMDSHHSLLSCHRAHHCLPDSWRDTVRSHHGLSSPALFSHQRVPFCSKCCSPNTLYSSAGLLLLSFAPVTFLLPLSLPYPSSKAYQSQLQVWWCLQSLILKSIFCHFSKYLCTRFLFANTLKLSASFPQGILFSPWK